MSELFSVIDALAGDDVHAIAESALLNRTETLLTARNKLDAEIARSLQATDIREVTTAECGRASRSWLIEEQFLAPEEAGRRLNVARALPFHPILAAAFAAGQLSHDHVRVILGCLRKLPIELRQIAESELTEAAQAVDPTSLGRACRELRVRVGADEDAEAAAQRQYESRWATVNRTFEGMIHLEAMLDPEAGATLQAALEPLLHPAGEIDLRTAGQRRADALTELARLALDAAQLPDHNGERPQVTVTISYRELCEQLAAGQLGNAMISGKYAISPSTARTLACDAGIIPAVLGGASEILDLGRATRTWSKAQRRAARLRDGGCVFPKCQAGLERCQLHHLKFWTLHHGPTDINNSAHLCHYHHHLVHHSPWTITRNAAGQIQVRRT
jgi:hypothetical protein